MTEAASAQDEQSASQGFVAATTTASENLRATAKWVLAAFAAVGGVIAAGIQLSNIGQVTDPVRLVVAAIAVVITFLAIGIVIRSAVRVLVSGQAITLKGLADEDANNKLPRDQRDYIDEAYLLAEFDSIAQLHQRYGAVIEAREEAYRNFDRAETEEAKRRCQAQINDLNDEVKYLGDGIVPQLLAAISLWRLRERFEAAVRNIFIWGAVAALGVTVFAWATTPRPSTAETPAFLTPVEATVHLTESDKARLAESLGEQCVQSPVRVIVLSVSSDKYDVVSVPEDQCKVSRFNVEAGSPGSIQPIDSVDLPAGNE